MIDRRRWMLLAAGMMLAGCRQGGPASAPALEAGKPGALEFTVAAVKYAPRRRMYFLSSSTNFRGASTSVVALRQKDVAGDPNRVLADFEKKFYGKRIRAAGDASEDEGQLLLFVASPEAIEVVPSAPGDEGAKPLEPHRSRHAS